MGLVNRHAIHEVGYDVAEGSEVSAFRRRQLAHREAYRVSDVGDHDAIAWQAPAPRVVKGHASGVFLADEDVLAQVAAIENGHGDRVVPLHCKVFACQEGAEVREVEVGARLVFGRRQDPEVLVEDEDVGSEHGRRDIYDSLDAGRGVDDVRYLGIERLVAIVDVLHEVEHVEDVRVVGDVDDAASVLVERELHGVAHDDQHRTGAHRRAHR